jgi:hypothetical protein
LGRYLTAASSTPVNNNNHHHHHDDHSHSHNDNSGAWVGEMAFIEACWGNNNNNDSAPRTVNAMYTVVAKEDCIVWRWTHDEMERLMARSPDMRDALTRAMTSAIVGKVISFTISRSSARPTWQTWLDDWNAKRSESHPVVTHPIITGEPSNDHHRHHEEQDHHEKQDHQDHQDEAPTNSNKRHTARVGRESPA